MKKESSNIIKGARIEGTVFAQSQNVDPDLIQKDSIISQEYIRGLEEGRKQGFEAGRLEGYELGYREGEQIVHHQFNDALKMLNLITAAFQVRKEELFEQLKPEILKFNINLMGKVLQQQLSNPDTFASLIGKLLEQISIAIKDVPITIVLSPEDNRMLSEKLKAIYSTENYDRKILFVEDSSMERGNCRLETTLGIMNFDISRLMKDLEIKVLEV